MIISYKIVFKEEILLFFWVVFILTGQMPIFLYKKENFYHKRSDVLRCKLTLNIWAALKFFHEIYKNLLVALDTTGLTHLNLQYWGRTSKIGISGILNTATVSHIFSYFQSNYIKVFIQLHFFFFLKYVNILKFTYLRLLRLPL